MYATIVALAMTGILRGDANCDGVVNFADINPFVTALTSGAVAWSQSTGCPVETYLCACDVNGDGVVDFDDLNPFVALVTGVQQPIYCGGTAPPRNTPPSP